MLVEPQTLTPELEALLIRSMFPDPERIHRTLEGYRADPGRRVFAWLLNGRPVSAAGVQPQGETVEVLHLGTAPGEEGRGYARTLLHAVAAHLGAFRIVAETHDDAAEFYRRAGFEVTPAPPRGGSSRHHAVFTRP